MKLSGILFRRWILHCFNLLPDEDGGVLIMTAVFITAILVCTGAAIDVGHFELEKRKLQSAADAAALAGALEVRTCNGEANCATMQSAAKDAVTENGYTASTFLTQCSGSSSSVVTLTLNNPVCESANDPNLGKSNYVEAVVSEQVPTYFAKLAGLNSVSVSAHSEASRSAGGPCIYALDPSGSAITIVAGVVVKSRCDIVDESTSPDALTCVIGVGISAPSIMVAGGSQGFLCGIKATPHTGAPVPNPADPLAYESAPDNANDACGTSTGSPYTGSSQAVNILLGSNVTFYPGVYCGGISITASVLSNITFEPGTYILRDAKGLLGITTGGLSITLSALSTITGNGVTFYNEGPTGAFTITEPVSGGSLISLSTFNLTAPTSGEYNGILFFQAHDVKAPATFLANLAEGGNLEGAVYIPDGSVSYGVSALSASYNILVAKDINFVATVGSSFGNDYSSLSNGSPLNGNNVRLVQ